jgi:hypothetical protein
MLSDPTVVTAIIGTFLIATLSAIAGALVVLPPPRN